MAAPGEKGLKRSAGLVAGECGQTASGIIPNL